MNSLWSQHRIAITLGATTFSLRSFVTGTFRFPTWFPKQNLLFRKEKRYLHRKRTLKLIHPLRRIDPCEFQSIGNSHPDRIVPKDIDFFQGKKIKIRIGNRKAIQNLQFSNQTQLPNFHGSLV